MKAFDFSFLQSCCFPLNFCKLLTLVWLGLLVTYIHYLKEEGKKGFFVFLFSCHMPDVSLQKPVLSHILVTVATFDKRAYKYIFRLSFNKLLCTEWPSPASPGPHWYSESFVILEQMKETSCLFFLNIFRRNPLTEKSWIQVALCGSCWVTTLKPLRGA